MFYKTAFWILTFLTAISAALQFLGFDFMNVLIVLLILDSISFGAVVELERKKSAKDEEFGEAINRKMEGLENMCKEVLQKVSVNSAVLELEEKLNMHKKEQKVSLDKIAEKTLELERKINKFGARLAEHMGLDRQEEEDDTADYVYIETGE